MSPLKLLPPLSSPDTPISVLRSPNDNPLDTVISSLSTPSSQRTSLPHAHLLTSAAALEVQEEKE